MSVISLKPRFKSTSHKTVESFKNAKLDIIPHLERGCHIFGITRGQYSLLDIVLAIVERYGPAELSVWTWAIAEYERDAIFGLIENGLVQKADLVIDFSTPRKHINQLQESKNTSEIVIKKWIEKFGKQSVRTVKTHAKIARIKCGDFYFVVRGSMNLNYNPRFEQFDITEGQECFDFVEQVEKSIKLLDPFECAERDAIEVSGLKDVFDYDQLNLFAKTKVWAK